MIEPTQIAEGPVLTSPEASNPQVVAPGQESLLEEFIQEQQNAGQPEPEKLLGKFSSVEDLEKSYLELKEKLSQGGSKAPDPEPTQQSNGYTADQAREVYGREIVDALQGQGVDLADLMWKADTGVDISESYDTLAAAFNVPRQVVENYVSASKKSPAPAPETPVMTAADEAAIKDQFGGEEGFADLSQWAQANLPKEDLESYNAVVDSGNRAGNRVGIESNDCSASSAKCYCPAEAHWRRDFSLRPRGLSPNSRLLDAMNKRNDRGQRLADVDESYRGKVAQLLAVSDVF